MGNALTILGGAVLGYTAVTIIKFLYNLIRANNWPGLRQYVMLPPLLSIMLPFPKWVVPWQRLSSLEYKWDNLYKLYGVDILSIITPAQVAFLVADAELAKEITTTRKEFFPKPTHLYGVVNIFGLNIVSTEDEVWRRHRKISSIGFTERNNKLVHQESAKYAMEMVNELKEYNAKHGKAGTADVVKYMLKVALCVIASASFGMVVNWDDHDEKPANGHTMSFFEAVEEIAGRPIPLILLPRWAYALPFYNLPRLGTAIVEYERYIKEKIAKVNEEEAKNGSSDGLPVKTSIVGNDLRKGDLFSSLIRNASEMKKQSSDLFLDESELNGNIYILMLAGHETTAHTLSFAFGLLALHPDAQEKLFTEVNDLCGSNDAPRYEDFINMKYGLAVMNETLRSPNSYGNTQVGAQRYYSRT